MKDIRYDTCQVEQIDIISYQKDSIRDTNGEAGTDIPQLYRGIAVAIPMIKLVLRIEFSRYQRISISHHILWSRQVENIVYISLIVYLFEKISQYQ